MHFTRALRWLGAPDKSHMGYCNQFSGLSDRMGRGFSVIRLVLGPPHPDPNPFCFQADWRWYSLFSNPFGTPLLDGQNQQLRSVATKNLLGVCSGICPSPSFSFKPLKSFAAPVKPYRSAFGTPLWNRQVQLLRSMARKNLFVPCFAVQLIVPSTCAQVGHAIVSRSEALDRATKLELDLVEVQRNANPPVCKIMDFHKEKFKQEVKEKERAKSKSSIALRSGDHKEVRFKAKIDLRDLKIKADLVVRLMERGYKIKCTAMPSGKEEEDLGGLISQLLPLIEDVSVIESGPHVDTRQAYVIVRHAKFATKKSGKKVSKVVETAAKGFQGAVSRTPEALSSTSQDGKVLQSEEWDPIDCSSEAEAEAQENFKEKADWEVFNNTNDSGDLFNFDSEGSGTHSGISGNADNASSGARLMDKNISDTSHHKVTPPVSGFTVPGPGLGSSRSVVETSEEPSVVDDNRYSKRTVVKGRFHQPYLSERNNAAPYFRAARNQGRTQQEPMRTEGQGHRVDAKQPQFYATTPSPSSPGISKVARTDGRSGDATTTKADDTDSSSKSYGIFSLKSPATGNGKSQPNLNISKPGDIGSHAPNYGIFSSSKVPNSELRNSGGETTAKNKNPSSPTPGYGIFSSSKVPNSELRNSGGETTAKNKNPSSPTPGYGIFSSSKVPNSELRNSGGETTAKNKNPSSPTPGYGNFSTKKPAASGDQHSGDSPPGKSDSSTPPTRGYGIFSATKSASSGN
ncbi:hypothetical protein C4D60_Mb06t07280 [Musa balbisiana]|uniref:Translation initiation factor 3 N-terminal domain-containing protein n=1 Tax=Musa balbisiana TaxID=52838 RepID=A0A4S8INQ4_MUSBA|nr:hypothetical protein C4D60_Mb06t07280 [Musa balbisiana]